MTTSMTTVDGRESPRAAPTRRATDEEAGEDHANLFSDDTMPALVELLTLGEFSTWEVKGKISSSSNLSCL